MKFLLLLSLGALALAGEDQMVNNWQKLKAMESCWGEENMKLYTVNMKKAIAKCSHEDAPELSLAPYRSTYRFVNAMLSSADQMENQQYSLMEKMLELMMQGSQYSSGRPSYSSYSQHGEGNHYMEKMKNKFYMKQMMQKMMHGDMYESNSPMSHEHENNNKDFMEMFRRMFGNNMDNSMDHFRSNSDSSLPQFFDMFRSRSKRAASEEGAVNPSLDLGDRLVEKLNEMRDQREAKIGNFTCVMKHMGYLNNDNEIDLNGMKGEKEYTMPSPWFAQRYDEMLETCYEMATNLPAQIEEQSMVTGETFGSVNLAHVRSFSACYEKAEAKLCMNHDIKKKIESNFGPLEEILEQTQLTEHQLFPLVIQLLHGEEMEYMMEDF